MKKNIVGNIIFPKKNEKKLIQRLDLLPRLLCLLLALIIWLLVVNVRETETKERNEDRSEITEILP